MSNKVVPEKTVTIGFGGDTMLGRLVNEKIKQTSYTYPWGTLLPLLKKTDLNIINLETTLTKSEQKVEKVFNFKSDPQNVQLLKAGSIDIVSLANNHSLDFGPTGLQETTATLDAAGIAHVGAGNNAHEAAAPVITTVHGITIGILGITDNEPGWQASENKPGINYIAVGNIQKVKPMIEALRPQVDLLVVTTHWGPNMRQRPTQAFQDFAHALIDTGVDIIHGHSAHIFQGIEIYKNKLILYDTGDFVDDYRVNPTLRNDHSFFFQVTIGKTGVKYLTLTPIIISNMQALVATGPEKRLIIQRMQKLSAEFGTHVPDNGLLTFD